MPTAYIKKLAKEGKGSVAELEKKWEEAKKEAKGSDATDKWAYTMGIFKKMIGASYSDIRRAVLAGKATGKGAGILFYAIKTRRFLLVKRSDEGDWSGTWACLGGGVDPGESIKEGALREAFEEGAFDGDVELVPLHVSEQPDFVYHNMLGILDDEFEPVLNDEHTEYMWVTRDHFPKPLHPDFAAALVSPEARYTLDALGETQRQMTEGMS